MSMVVRKRNPQFFLLETVRTFIDSQMKCLEIGLFQKWHGRALIHFSTWFTLSSWCVGFILSLPEWLLIPSIKPTGSARNTAACKYSPTVHPRPPPRPSFIVSSHMVFPKPISLEEKGIMKNDVFWGQNRCWDISFQKFYILILGFDTRDGAFLGEPKGLWT